MAPVRWMNGALSIGEVLYMSILVTGGAGFIGSHIVDSLINEGEQVVVVDDLSTGRSQNLHPKARFYKLDIRDRSLGDLFAKENITGVIHQAAQISVSRSLLNPEEDADVNIRGTLLLLRLCRQHQVRRVVFASSAAVYGNPRHLPIDEDHLTCPLSPYGISKLTGERYLAFAQEAWELSFAALRYANVYGPRQIAAGEGGVIAIFADQLCKKEAPVIWGDGEQTRDFVYVKDVARANVLALKQASEGIFNIGGGRETSINKLLAQMTRAAKTEIKAQYQPSREGDIKNSCLDFKKAREKLQWQAQVGLEEGLEKTLAWTQQQVLGGRRP